MTTKSLLGDLSRREVEEPIYGGTDEHFRIYEDVYGLAWPDRDQLESEADEEC